MSIEDPKNPLSDTVKQVDDNLNWVDGEDSGLVNSPITSSKRTPQKQTKVPTDTVVMVETAFLASAASLVWLINYYFPLGPVLKIFLPIPIALIYLRRGNRASRKDAG